MKERKRTRAPGLPPLPPEAEDRLQSQVAQVAAALASGQEVDALRGLITPSPQDPLWDLHLMAALGHLADPAIPPLLAGWFGGSPDKTRRKALKKTLHLLRTRGVPVPADVLPREESALGAAPRTAGTVFVSPIFGHGESYVILEGPPEILGGNFLVSRVSDQEGFRECHLLNVKRKQQAEFWDHFREQGLGEWFSPPAAFAVRLLEEAYARGETDSGAGRYGSLREKILPYWGRPETAPEPEQARPPLDPGERHRYLEQSRQLAAHPLFLSWMPGMEELAPWIAKLQEVQDSPLVLSDQQRQVRLEAVMDEATQALYPPETRAAWRRRLFTMAYYLELKGQREEALAAQAAGEDLAEADRGLLKGENPFLKALVQYSLQVAWELKKPQEAAAPSGLVAPPTESLLIRR